MAYGGVGGASVGVLSVGALGDAPAPAAPPAVVARTLRLRIVGRDPVTNAILFDDLPHLHSTVLDMVGFQAGAAGRSSIGDVRISLFPPGSDEYRTAHRDYGQIDYGIRLELYRGDIIAGDPVASVIVTGIEKDFSGYTLTCQDSLVLLTTQRTSRTEVFSGTTDALVKYALKGSDLSFGDDFSAGLGNFTNDGNWVVTSNPNMPVGATTAIAPGTGGDGLLYTVVSGSNANYADCLIEVPFWMACESAPGASAEVSIVAALADTSNFVMGQALLRYVTSSRFELTLAIWQKVGGSYGAAKSSIATFALPNAYLPGGLELKGYQVSLTQYLWRLTLNGSDIGCFWAQPVNGGAPTGKVGVRSLKSGTGQGNQVVYIGGKPEGFASWSKSYWFQPGRISLGTQSVNQAISDTPHMDLLQLAGTTEGGEYRKNPKAGINQDTVDFGRTVGSDYSAMIRFEEGINVVDAKIEPNAEDFGNIMQSPASPSLGGSGWVRHTDIASVKARGARVVHNPAARVSDILAHRLFAHALTNLSSNPGQAKRVTVKRDEWTERVRPLDYVELDLPSLGIYKARAKVMGRKDVEGQGTVEFLLDQLPRTTDRIPKLDRLLSTVATLAARADENSATDPSKPFAVMRDNRALLPINPYEMRVWVQALQNIACNAATVVAFDTVSFDPSGSFNAPGAPAGSWRAPASGRYQTNVCLNPVTPAAAQTWLGYVSIAVVGSITNWATGPQSYAPTNALGGQMGVSVNDILYLNAGDVVQVSFYGNAVGGGAGNFQMGGQSYLYFWSMQLISG